jgi:tetratricopeptide (TPR) repeat protein
VTWQWTCRRLRQARRLLARAVRDQRAGRVAMAEQRGQQALELLGRDGRHRHVIDRLAICQAVASLQQARAAYDSAAALLEDALGIAQGEAAVEPLVLLGNVRRLQGRYGDAETCLLRARGLAEQTQLAAWRQARVLNGLALIYKDTADYDEAAQLYRQALRATAQNDLLGRATLQHNLAGLAHAQGKFLHAEQPARCAVELRTALLGRDHPEVAADLAVLGAVLYGQERHDEAEMVFNQALTAFQRHYGPDHYEVAVNLGNLGALYAATDRADRAQQSYERALQIKRRLLGCAHPEIATLLNNLAVLHKQRGRLPAAQQCYEQALTIFESTLGPKHPSTRTCRDNLERLPPTPRAGQTPGRPSDAKPTDHRPERTGGAMNRHRTPILTAIAAITAVGALAGAALVVVPARATHPTRPRR